MSFAVSGLSSGLDTSALVAELMFAERATVRRLEASQKNHSDALDAWTDIEAKLGELRTATSAIRNGSALEAALAESSDESVLRLTAQDGALPGSYSFQVDQLAAAQQVTSTGLTSGADLTGAGTATVSAFGAFGNELQSHTLNAGTYTLTVLSVDLANDEATVVFDGIEQTVALTGGRNAFTVTAGDGGTLDVREKVGETLTTGSGSITVIEADATTTVNGVAAALNASGGPVRAQVIDTGDGTSTSYRLVITGRDTGLANEAAIDLDGLSVFSGGFTTLRDASDATISLGNGGLTITRSTNTIGDLFDGLSIDLVGVSNGEDVEVVVSADIDKRVEVVTAVVDAATAVLSQLSTYSSYDVDSGEGGPLVGNFTARSVSREVTEAMGTVVSSNSFVLLSQIGISVQFDGTYQVDEAKLRDALTTDPAGVERVLVGDPAIDDDGVLDMVGATIDQLVGESGRIPTAKQAAEDNIDELQRSIDLQETRLEAVEDRYLRQFTALETLIAQMQSQSSYLTSLLGQQQSPQQAGG